MNGRAIAGSIHESIRLFALCSLMKWSHLPVAGGLYDQHPKLLEEWEVIFQKQNEVRAKEQEELTRKASRNRR